MQAARRATGLSHWGNDSFRAPFQHLLASLQGEARLPFVARLWFHQTIQRNLVNRLKIQSDLERYPEISRVPVRRPIFVIGMARTGTTFLQRLLAQDPASRAFRYWELCEPSPPPDPQSFERDPRRRKLMWAESFLKRFLFTRSQRAALQAAHPVGADDPEECEHLFMNSFMSLTMAALSATVSRRLDYVRWLHAQDREWVYREHRQQVQLMSWRSPGERLVLKCPAHFWALDALLKVYPDASLIWTHRDAAKQVASMCNNLSLWMLLFLQAPYDLQELGPALIEDLDTAIRRALAVRSKAEPARFYDLVYQDLVNDPIGAVRGIYSYFDYELTGEAEEAMRRWLTRERRRKRGRNVYYAEDFGLTTGEIHHRFRSYQERFDIPVERR